MAGPGCRFVVVVYFFVFLNAALQLSVLEVLTLTQVVAVYGAFRRSQNERNIVAFDFCTGFVEKHM